jgi:endonuclease/exonuclease/phosphatase family metal-dependent hydrolase
MATDPTTSWRVVTWNILGAKDPDLARVAATIRDLHPDVAAFQEVRRSQIRRLARDLGWRFTWARKHYPYSPLVWWRAEGLAIVSPWAVAQQLHTTITPGVSTWTYRHRILVAATITRRDGALRVFNTHLSSDDADQRIEQAARVADRIRADTARVRVLTGDLNTTAGGEVEVLRELRAVGLVDPGGSATNPAIAPRQRLDYVLVPEDGAVIDAQTPDGGETWAELSDHLPVLVEFTQA